MRCGRTLMVLVLVLPSLARGGQVLFKNGDRLTGKITEVSEGKLTIESAVAGKLTVSLDQVQTFWTEQAVEVELKDGRIIRQRLDPDGMGRVRPVLTMPTTVPATQPVHSPMIAAATLPSSRPAAATTRAGGIELAQIKSLGPISKAQPWAGSVAAGLMIARGNSHTTTANATFQAMKRNENDRLTFMGAYNYSRERDVSTGEDHTAIDNWNVSGQYDYYLTEKLYLYGRLPVERDRVADLNLRLSPTVGAGYQWWESPKTNFRTELGVGYVYEDFDSDGINRYATARLAYHYDRKLNDRVSLFHDLEYLPSVEDFDVYKINADLGLHVSLTAKMFSEAKVEWQFNSQPAPGAEENDLRYILSLGWQF